MTAMAWGLLGPERIVSERRTRTLGLATVVRTFNDLAVPGMGNVWFGKQLFLATLGVSVAERLRAAGMRVHNIETANAIEALACWLTFRSNDWSRDRRLQGINKMRARREAPFSEARKKRFYVTQPLRMSTVQPLPTLGLVTSNSERFNTFVTADFGNALLQSVCDANGPSYRSKSIIEHLVQWGRGSDSGIDSQVLFRAISPTTVLPKHSRDLVRGLITQSGARGSDRRRAVLEWVREVGTGGGESWDTKPPGLEPAHWLDLHAGTKFFATRAAAIAFLEELDVLISEPNPPRIPVSTPLSESAESCAEQLRFAASAFLELGYDPSFGSQASAFCRECMDRSSLLYNIVRRDGRVLQLANDAVIPGPAFRNRTSDLQGTAAETEEEDDSGKQVDVDLQLPVHISHRVGYLRMLDMDLNGRLGKWLERQS